MNKLILITSVLLVFISTAISAEFWASSQTHRYHYPTCQLAKLISKSNLTIFSSPQAALNSGYNPCRTCAPPKK